MMILTPEELRLTAMYLHGLRREDGGYAKLAGDATSRQQPTTSVIKALALFGDRPRDPEGAEAFILRCRHAQSGGFAAEPGGEPDVFMTALALISLKEVSETALAHSLTAAMRYMLDTASSDADHFMIIAAHEECQIQAPFPAASIAHFEARLLPDKTFGEGTRVNAIACSSAIRAGEDRMSFMELADLFLGAQQPDGGFADGDAPSDLVTTYMVMRILDLLGQPPDLNAVARYVHGLRRTDGGYASAADAGSDADATYWALSIFDWIQQAADRPAEDRPGNDDNGERTTMVTPGETIPAEDIDGAIAAARRGDADALRAWLTSGGDPDRADAEGWTPLLAAASRGRAGVVDLLLRHDIAGARHADPNQRFAGADALPIYMAGQSGDLETVKILLEVNPEHLFQISSVNGHTVLLQAAFYSKEQHLELAEYLLEHVGSILSIPDGDTEATKHARWRLCVATNVRGFTALRMNEVLWKSEPMMALLRRFDRTTRAEQQRYCEQLLNRIATPQGITERLMRNIEDGLAEMRSTDPDDADEIAEVTSTVLRALEDVLETPGCDVNRRGGDLQQPPLVLAVTGFADEPHVAVLRKAITKALLEHGADPDIPEAHPMAVDAVIRTAVLHQFELLQLLAEYMPAKAFAAAMNAKPAVNGLTALHDSVHRALMADAADLPGRLEQIRWMVARGARPDLEDHTGQTQEQLARDGLNDPVFKENAPKVLEALGLS